MARLLLRPAEAAELIGVGRSKMYALLAASVLLTVRVASFARGSAKALEPQTIDFQSNKGADDVEPRS